MSKGFEIYLGDDQAGKERLLSKQSFIESLEYDNDSKDCANVAVGLFSRENMINHTSHFENSLFDYMLRKQEVVEISCTAVEVIQMGVEMIVVVVADICTR